MGRRIAWMLALAVGLGWVAGCGDKSEPVEQGPDQEAQLLTFPENQVPQAEPQPVDDVADAPPVDTKVDDGGGSAQLPKESYVSEESRKARVYVVTKGDTLQNISRKFYKTHKKWREIYNANRDLLADGPDKLQIGMKLKIP